jgi:APA family basic amino acid/polyamine antiporter
MAIALMISAYGTIHVGSLWAPRLPYAMARDGLLPRYLAHVSPRGVPIAAVWTCGALAVAFTFSGEFDVITDIYVFILWCFYGLTCASLFVLRRKFPNVQRPFRVWGYPAVPTLFLLVTAF